MHREQGRPSMEDMGNEGAKPPGLEDIKDTRSGMEKAEAMDLARREKMAEAEIAELRAKWDAEEKAKQAPAEKPPEPTTKEIWDAEKKQLASEVTDLRTKMREVKDEQGESEAKAAAEKLLAKIVEQAIRENPNLGTEVIKTAIALPDIKGKALEEGINYITKALIKGIKKEEGPDKGKESKSDYFTKLETLLQGPAKEPEIVAAMQKGLKERIEPIRKGVEQKAQMKKGLQPEAAKVVDIGAKRKEMSKEEKRKAVHEAMKPVFKEIKEKLPKKPQAKKKPSWWDKLTGKAA